MHDNTTFGPTTFPGRHLFLDVDNLVEWEHNLEQRFYQAEKAPITGMEPGPAGSWDARDTSAYGTTLLVVCHSRVTRCGRRCASAMPGSRTCLRIST